MQTMMVPLFVAVLLMMFVLIENNTPPFFLSQRTQASCDGLAFAPQHQRRHHSSTWIGGGGGGGIRPTQLQQQQQQQQQRHYFTSSTTQKASALAGLRFPWQQQQQQVQREESDNVDTTQTNATSTVEEGVVAVAHSTTTPSSNSGNNETAARMPTPSTLQQQQNSNNETNVVGDDDSSSRPTDDDEVDGATVLVNGAAANTTVRIEEEEESRTNNATTASIVESSTTTTTSLTDQQTTRPLILNTEQQQQPPSRRRSRDIKFTSPPIDYGYPPACAAYLDGSLYDKPLLLYLPGFDGTFLAPFIQFPELSTDFDVRCLNVGSGDQSTFDELRDSVLEFLYQETITQRDDAKGVDDDDDQQQQQAQTTTNTTTSSLAMADPNAKDMSPFAIVSRLLLSILGFPPEESPSPDNKDTKNKNNNKKRQRQQQRPIYLVGESFGGLLASEVSLSILNSQNDDSDGPAALSVPAQQRQVSLLNLQGLTLINAATCYDRSKLAAEGPVVAQLHPLLYPIGLLRLLPLFADEHSFEQLLLILQAKALPSVIDDASREAYLGRVAFSLPFVLPTMPQSTLQWRLERWLDDGCAQMASKLSEFNDYPDFRTLIVAGENDATLPSIAEAERLASLLPNSRVHVVEGAGHASTCGSRVDLAALLRDRFDELQTQSTGGLLFGWMGGSGSNAKNATRTQMKDVASAGVGAYFGMEPRYDDADIGLNPLLYWSRDYYRRVRAPSSSVMVSSEEEEGN